MRITILTTGSRGDVQPFLALGLGLQAAGHQVRVATHGNFEGFIRGYGLDFSSLSGDPRAILETAEGQDLLASGGNPVRLWRSFVRLIEPLAHQCLADGLKACADADAVVFTVTSMFGYWIAEKLGVPSVAAYNLPLTPTFHFTSAAFAGTPPWLPFGAGLYNRLTYTLGGMGMWWPLRGVINRARQEVLGLAPLPLGRAPWRDFRPGFPYLYGYSPAVLLKPADWDEHKHVTGYWFLDRPRAWQAPAGLVDFLEAGPPPVYVGFGSMNNRDAGQVTEVVVKALRRCGQRGVLLTGWGGLAEVPLPECVYPVASVPHDWLFPRMAAVVHHGGAGTTAAGLRAGVPAVVVPFMSDQPFWARRVYELGAGPRPLPRRRLTAPRLEEAIRAAVTDPDMRRRAAALGQCVRAEDGVARAVDLFHRYLPAGRPAAIPVPSYPRYPLDPAPFQVHAST